MSTQFLRGRATCQRLFSHSKTKPMDEDLTAGFYSAIVDALGEEG
jgi:hypothetical protein